MIQRNVKNFLFQTVPTGSGAHPASYSTGTGASFSGVQQWGHLAEHSSASTELKNEWSYTSISTIAFIVCTGTALHLRLSALVVVQTTQLGNMIRGNTGKGVKSSTT